MGNTQVHTLAHAHILGKWRSNLTFLLHWPSASSFTTPSSVGSARCRPSLGFPRCSLPSVGCYFLFMGTGGEVRGYWGAGYSALRCAVPLFPTTLPPRLGNIRLYRGLGGNLRESQHRFISHRFKGMWKPWLSPKVLGESTHKINFLYKRCPHGDLSFLHQLPVPVLALLFSACLCQTNPSTHPLLF